MPGAVKRGDNAVLQCRFDLEGDSLYSVKWYKGRREFFRYTPKENPPVRTFNAPGVQINVSPICSVTELLVLLLLLPGPGGKREVGECMLLFVDLVPCGGGCCKLLNVFICAM